MYNSDITLQLILHKLREDLLKYRKCFSGAQLVNWVMKNPDLVKSLGMILLAFYSRKHDEVQLYVGKQIFSSILLI
jgi:hypothetical protein